MQAHFLGAGQDALRKSELHHHLAARDRQPAIERPESRRKCAETIDDLLGGDVGPVLQMPCVRVVAVRAAEQAARDEQDRAQARSVVAG